MFGKKKKNQINAENDLNSQDINELKGWSQEDFENPEKIKKYLRKKKRRDLDPIVRVEDVQAAMLEHGEDISPEAIVSMYIPRRRAKRIGAALLRMDKLKLGILGLLALIIILFIAALSQEKMGNFTINLDRLEMFRRGISISSDAVFTDPTAKLEAASIEDATNTTLADLPTNLDSIDGDHNGRNYVAYTYYVRNAGKETLKYKATVKIENASKGADAAVRVAVYRNGERVICAKARGDGSPEPGTVPFVSEELAYEHDENDFRVGYVDKYTVVIWLEGEDPQCVDSIVGGALQFSMNIDALEDKDSGIVAKLIEDIKDTITGNNPIGAAGQGQGPNYYEENLTYHNRLNK